MCNEILPENVNLLLDDFERALCLPILLGIIYFTAVLAIPLATSIYGTAQGYLDSGSGSRKKSSCKRKSFMDKMKGIIGLSLFSSSPSYAKSDSETWSASTQNFAEYDCDDDDDVDD